MNRTGYLAGESRFDWRGPMRQFGSSLVLVTLSCASALLAQADSGAPGGYLTIRDLPYRDGAEATEYMREQCRLDVYYPADKKGFPTVVWFHGGGLKGGMRSVPRALEDAGIAVVAVSYRLSPRVKAPAYVEDAAAAVAWTFEHIEEYGGDVKRIFVSGHSAGGYLTSMVGLDKRWLAAHRIDADRIAGLIPYSGQTVTHSTVRAERGIDPTQPVVDDLAPLFHVRKNAPPFLLITGDRELELRGRYEENAYLWRMMQVVGHPDSELFELDGFDHGQMAQPAHALLVRFVARVGAEKAKAADDGARLARRTLEEFASRWDESAWTSPKGSRKYMRPLGDKGWKERFLALQRLVQMGKVAVPVLVDALKIGDGPARILAAQALSYLAPHAPLDALERSLREDDLPAVRLYAADALGMRGEASTEFLKAELEAQRNRDVKRHIDYALERGGEPVLPEVVRTLASWDAAALDTAVVGEAAPDFELSTVGGKRVRLSDFRGDKHVVLVFVYGDT